MVTGTYSITARAVKYSVVFVLDYQQMQHALMRYPNERTWLLTQCKRCRSFEMCIKNLGTAATRRRFKAEHEKKQKSGHRKKNANLRMHASGWADHQELRGPRARPQVKTKVVPAGQPPAPSSSTQKPTKTRGNESPRLTQRHSRMALVREPSQARISASSPKTEGFGEQFVLWPDSDEAAQWRFLVCAALLLQTICIPLNASFAYDRSHGENATTIVLIYLADIVLAADIWMSFRKATIQEGGVERDPKSIRERYIRTRLPRHILAQIPFELPMVASPLAPYLRLPRLLRLRELMDLLSEFSHYESTTNKRTGTFVRLTALVVTYICCAHLAGSVYFSFVQIHDYGGAFLPSRDFQTFTPLRRYMRSIFMGLNMLGVSTQ